MTYLWPFIFTRRCTVSMSRKGFRRPISGILTGDTGAVRPVALLIERRAADLSERIGALEAMLRDLDRLAKRAPARTAANSATSSNPGSRRRCVGSTRPPDSGRRRSSQRWETSSPAREGGIGEESGRASPLSIPARRCLHQPHGQPPRLLRLDAMLSRRGGGSNLEGHRRSRGSDENTSFR